MELIIYGAGIVALLLTLLIIFKTITSQTKSTKDKVRDLSGSIVLIVIYYGLGYFLR